MATLTKYATTFTTSGTTWTNPSYIGADDTSWATAAPSSKNTTIYVTLGSFGFDTAIPSGATINSVTMEAELYFSTTASIASAVIQSYVSAVAFGAAISVSTEPVGAVTVSGAVTGATYSNLLDSQFTVRLSVARGNSTTVFSCYINYLSVIVDYTSYQAIAGQADGLSTTTAAVALTIGLGGAVDAVLTADGTVGLDFAIGGQAAVLSTAEAAAALDVGLGGRADGLSTALADATVEQGVATMHAFALVGNRLVTLPDGRALVIQK